jgi:hypothetical protein
MGNGTLYLACALFGTSPLVFRMEENDKSAAFIHINIQGRQSVYRLCFRYELNWRIRVIPDYGGSIFAIIDK